MQSEDERRSETSEAPLATPVVTSTPVQTAGPASPQPIKGVKLYFLGLIIAAAAAMGITSVLALLIGGFNDIIGKAVLTIFILLTHALLALTIVATARTEYLKRSIIGTTLLICIAASLVTTILGTWGIITSQLSWHFLGLYFLAIGGAFITTWFKSALIGQKKSDTIILAALVSTVAFVIVLAPWVLTQTPTFPSIYYRIVAAIGIIIATLMIIGSIVRQILLSHKVATKRPSIFRGLSAAIIIIYSIVGGITFFVWLAGTASFSIDAFTLGRTISPYTRSYEDDDNYNTSPDINTYDPSDPYDDDSYQRSY